MQFQGIYTPVITPFHADYAIDRKGWAGMIEALIAQGGHGLVIGGSTGEFYALTRDERLAQFREAQDIIGGRVPWLAGPNDFRTQDCCDLAVAAREAGADGLLVAAPPYSVPTEKELASHCLAIDRAAGLPIMLYNYPGRTGTTMGDAFLQRVAQSANFQAIKESSGDVGRIHTIAREFPQLQLSCGADDLALEFFVWGARSWVCAAANFLMEECVALYEVCVRDGDFHTGRRIMMAMLPLMTVLERGGKFLPCVKYACELQGLPGGAVRPPLRPLKKELKRQMRDVLTTAKTTIAAILAEKQAHSRFTPQVVAARG